MLWDLIVLSREEVRITSFCTVIEVILSLCTRTRLVLLRDRSSFIRSPISVPIKSESPALARQEMIPGMD